MLSEVRVSVTNPNATVNPFLNDICEAVPQCEQCQGKALPIQSSCQKRGSVREQVHPWLHGFPGWEERNLLCIATDSHPCLTRTLRPRSPKEQLEPDPSDEDANRAGTYPTRKEFSRPGTPAFSPEELRDETLLLQALKKENILLLSQNTN